MIAVMMIFSKQIHATLETFSNERVGEKLDMGIHDA